ncbi:MAG: WD40 repeat domain-containing protein, partial [Acidobacteriaceae bacterium]
FGRVVIFDAKSRSFVHAIDTSQGIVQSVAISPDDKVLASAGDRENGRIVLWNIQTGKRTMSFEVKSPVVKELRFLAQDRLFVDENGGPIYVIDLANGRRVFEADYEFWPVLSADGSLLITSTYQGFVLRSTSDFHILRKLPKPSKNAFPLAFSQRHDLLIVEDPLTSDGFVELRLSDGTLLPSRGLVKSLVANPSAGYFGAIQESTGIVFGHSDAKLWAWYPSTGRYCSTKTLYSEAGALSPDGGMVASGIDNGFFSGKSRPTGVLMWNTADVLKRCGMSSHLQSRQPPARAMKPVQ